MARENIRALRKLRKLSQGSLAKKVGLTPSEISRIECGYRDLSSGEAKAIANALGVSVREIEDKSPEPPIAVAASAVAVAQSVVPAPIPSPAPVSGNDLNDPANFRELPDFDLLRQEALDAVSFRTRLGLAIERATKILHTSKVPAAVWRAWRDFERQAQAVFRGSDANSAVTMIGSATNSDDRPPGNARLASTDAITLSEDAIRSKRSSKERHRERSYNALFFEAARRILPRDVATALTAEAKLRRQRDPTIGFMRHFRFVAQNSLPQPDVKRIVEAIEANEFERRPDRYAGDPANSSFNLQSRKSHLQSGGNDAPTVVRSQSIRSGHQRDDGRF